ncbi:M20/M25/M40 family metallo-hydrolase, partial [Tritonibacter mobilis]
DSTASNVIAHRAKLKGTVRTLDAENRELAEDRVRRVAEDTASAFGATAKVTWTPGYPVTENTADEVAHAVEAARAVTDSVDPETAPIMPSEDFAYMLEARPGAYIFLGNGDTAMCHHPAYQFDDSAIPLGCSWFVELCERRMPAS